MPRQLHLEGPALEPVLARAREEHGADVTVIAAHRVRRGGFAGFFAREHFEVIISVPSPEDVTPVPVQRQPLAVDPAPMTMAELLAAADRADVAAQPAAQPLAQPLAQPAAQPLAQPAAQPLAQPLAQPVAHRVVRPVTAPVPRPAPQQLAMPAAAEAFIPALVVPSLAAPSLAAPALAAQVPDPTAAAPVVASPSGVVLGARRPGRTLSTETRDFDDVLAALRADLLGPIGPDTTRLAPLTSYGDTSLKAAPAQPWLPVTVLDEPAPLGPPADPDPPGRTQDLEATEVPEAVEATEATEREEPLTPTEPLTTRTATELPATGNTIEPSPEPTPAAAPGPAVASGRPDAPGVDPDALRTTDLVTLARLVGADAGRAQSAAADVTCEGPVARRHALPRLADALAASVTDDLTGGPTADLACVRAGEVVVVLGAPEGVGATARQVAAHLGTPWLARWSDGPTEGRARTARHVRTAGRSRTVLVVQEVERIQALRTRAREAGLPLVLQLADPTLGDGTGPSRAGAGRSALLGEIDPHLVVLTVDARTSNRRRQVVADRVSAGCRDGASLVLALTGCSQAYAPLAHADRPVALLDGRPATRGTWTGVLLDAMRDAVGS